MTQAVTTLLSILTLVALAAVLVIVIGWLTHRTFVNAFFARHALLLAFIVTLAATLGSLFYSEVAHYDPCKLCWFQRILMYPQTLLLGIALWKRDRGIARYGLWLSVVGFLIAGYHYLLQLGVVPALSCSAVGYSASCSKRFVLTYGFITIPMMAWSAFALLVAIFAAALKRDASDGAHGPTGEGAGARPEAR